MDEAQAGLVLEPVAGRYAVCMRSLEHPREVLSQDFRCLEPFPAASVIKVGIMSALLFDVANGRLDLDSRITLAPEDNVGGAGVLQELETTREFSLGELCKLMMVISDNVASNACLRQVGMGRLNSFFSTRGYDASVKRFFMQPAQEGKDNTMTAEAAAYMLADLYHGIDLTPELKEFALTCLRRQQFREKIPLMLPDDLTIGHKTGELDGVRHDAGVVESDIPYIVVLLTANGDKPWLVDQAMAECSLNLYKNRHSILGRVSL